METRRRGCETGARLRYFEPTTAADGEKIGPVVTLATPKHDGTAPNAALVAMFHRLEEAGRRRASTALAEKEKKQKDAAAVKRAKAAEVERKARELASATPGLDGTLVFLRKMVLSPRGYSDGSRRRRGWDVDIPWRRVATAPWLGRG